MSTFFMGCFFLQCPPHVTDKCRLGYFLSKFRLGRRLHAVKSLRLAKGIWVNNLHRRTGAGNVGNGQSIPRTTSQVIRPLNSVGAKRDAVETERDILTGLLDRDFAGRSQGLL